VRDDIPVEIYVMEAMAACFQSDQTFQAEPHVRRRIAYDTQGYIAELLAKAVGKGALDEQLDEGDRAKLLDLAPLLSVL
jgi:monoamine oxidase